MSSHQNLARWSAFAQPTRYAAELLAVEHKEALDAALINVTRDLGSAAFLFARIDQFEVPSLDRATTAFHRSGARTRLCLAGDFACLARLDVIGIDHDRVGLMLDDVGEETPMSELIWDRIEAVCFRSDFIARAARNLRISFALEAMVGLAKDLGLCTLGCDTKLSGATPAGQADFDYVPEVERAPRRHAIRARHALISKRQPATSPVR